MFYVYWLSACGAKQTSVCNLSFLCHTFYINCKYFPNLMLPLLFHLISALDHHATDTTTARLSLLIKYLYYWHVKLHFTLVAFHSMCLPCRLSVSFTFFFCLYLICSHNFVVFSISPMKIRENISICWHWMLWNFYSVIFFLCCN